MFGHKTILFVATAALLLPACGSDDGDDKVAAGEYASQICTAFSDWRDAIQQGERELDDLESGISPEEGKEAFAGFIDDALSESETLVQEVEDAGTPDAENGEEAADALQEVAEGVQREFEEARADVEDLPTGDQQQFAAAITQLGQGVKNALTGVDDGINDVESPELEKAFEEESACK